MMGQQKKGERIAPPFQQVLHALFDSRGDWTLACSLHPIFQMGIWARLDSRLQPPPHRFSRRNFLTFGGCVQLATSRCGRLQPGAVLTSPKSRSVKWPGPLDRREELAAFRHNRHFQLPPARRWWAASDGCGRSADRGQHRLHPLPVSRICKHRLESPWLTGQRRGR